MSDFYSEMTDNMKMLFDDILASLGQLPDEKKPLISLKRWKIVENLR